MQTFEITLNEERNAVMTMYLNLESAEFGIKERPVMVVLPGGGYGMCSDREAELVALQYMSAGYQACVLRYTLKDKGGWPNPLNDYDECMEVIAQHAGQWHIDMTRIAVVGFSAGGHLAACAATLAKHKPRAAVCVYAAILPDIVNACQPGMPYPNEHCDGDTSPCFIAAARDDGVVNVQNSLAFAKALEEAGVNFEMHIYSYGQHGFSVGTPLIATSPITPRAAHWLPDSIGWLGELMGTLTDKGFTEPVLDARMNADFAACLSVKCSLKHIREQPENVQKIMEPLYNGMREAAANMNSDFESLSSALGAYTIKALMETVQAPIEAIWQLDAALNAIPNTL